MNGLGGYVPALLGALIGIVISVPLALVLTGAAVAANDSTTAIAIPLGLGLLPVIGAMLGYEISSSHNADTLRMGHASKDVKLTPLLANGRVTGGAVMLSITGW